MESSFGSSPIIFFRANACLSLSYVSYIRNWLLTCMSKDIYIWSDFLQGINLRSKARQFIWVLSSFNQFLLSQKSTQHTIKGFWLLKVHGFSSWQYFDTGGDRWLLDSESHCSCASSVKSSSSQQWMMIIKGAILEAGTEDASITPLLFFFLFIDLSWAEELRNATLLRIKYLDSYLSVSYFVKTLVQLCVTALTVNTAIACSIIMIFA